MILELLRSFDSYLLQAIYMGGGKPPNHPKTKNPLQFLKKLPFGTKPLEARGEAASILNSIKG